MLKGHTDAVNSVVFLRDGQDARFSRRGQDLEALDCCSERRDGRSNAEVISNAFFQAEIMRRQD